MVVVGQRKSCFHMAITGTNADIENAKEVCAQAVLYRSAEDNPDLYYSVYDSRTQKVFFCLCDPAKQEMEDVSCYSMQGEADKVSEWLKTCIVSNAEVLRW
jgi:malonyl CoA-acyl carrier protein transacylase